MNKLTIAIPAYERPSLLSEALLKAITASKGYNVDFLVCDDSPERVNESIIKRFQGSVSIRYIANKCCMGIDANIKKCFDEADTEYVWVIGEDDHVTRNAVQWIFESLEHESPHVIFLNYVYCSNDYIRDLSAPLICMNQQVSRIEILQQYYKFGFIGSYIVSKNQWDKYTLGAPLGTYFHHLSVMGKIVFSMERLNVGIVEGVCVRNRAEDADSASWVKQALEVHFGYYSAIEHFSTNLTSYEVQTLLKFSKKLFRPHNALWLLSKRADGAYHIKAWKVFFQNENFLKRFFLGAVACFPVRLAKVLKCLYFTVRRG